MAKFNPTDGERAKLMIAHISALEGLARTNAARYSNDCFLNFELMTAIDNDKAIKMLDEYLTTVKDRTAELPSMMSILQPIVLEVAERLVNEMKNMTLRTANKPAEEKVVVKDDADLETLR